MNTLKNFTTDLEELATRPSYRLLAKAHHVEEAGRATYDSYLDLRQYPPCKRTIMIEGKQYFLQFPSLVFLWTGSKYRNNARGFATGVFAAFSANKKIISDRDLIYQAPLPNVFDAGRVCMPSPDVHTCDNFVETFWQSAFRGYNYSSNLPQETLKANFGSLVNWQRLTLNQVNDKLCYMPIPVKSVITNTWMYPHDWFGAND
jgi:hypothetical protein